MGVSSSTEAAGRCPFGHDAETAVPAVEEPKRSQVHAWLDEVVREKPRELEAATPLTASVELGRWADDYRAFSFISPQGYTRTQFARLPKDTQTMIGRCARDVLAMVFNHPTRLLIEKANAIHFEGPETPLPFSDPFVSRAAMGGAAFEASFEQQLPPSLQQHLVQTKERLESTVELGHYRAGDVKLIVPVGEYGTPATQALIDAARILSREVINDPDLVKACDAVSRSMRKTLRRWTFWGVPEFSRMQTSAVQTILIDSLGSYANALGLLTAHAFEDLPFPELLDQIHHGKLLNQLAMRAPLGMLASLSNTGLVPTASVQRGPRGLLLADPFADLVGFERAPTTLPYTTQGCPMAVREPASVFADEDLGQSPVSALGEEFIRLAKERYAELTKDSSALK